MSAELPGGMPTILLVEDHNGWVRLFELALKAGRFPARLEVSVDALAALGRLERSRSGELPLPSLIVLDLNLPHLEGRVILHQVRRDLVLRTVPLVILSSSVEDEVGRVLAQRYGVEFYRKPIDLPELWDLGRRLGFPWKRPEAVHSLFAVHPRPSPEPTPFPPSPPFPRSSERRDILGAPQPAS